jgi:formamidopyrimidine-DNA glycosylase
MPELPEAETIVRDLRSRIPGAGVEAVEVPRPDILAPGLDPRSLHRRLRGRTIRDVDRRGKNVTLVFGAGGGKHDTLRLVINLGMTGRVITSDAPRARELRHVAARIRLDDGRHVLYDDARRFGRFQLLDDDGWHERDRALGVEPLSDSFTPELLHQLTRRSATPVRNWLLDQRRVAGVGNIYAVEALFRAGIRPSRRARTLTRAESGRLHRALRDVLTESIAARGTTISDYRDAAGEAGTFDRLLRVYDRTGEPCLVCHTPIKRVVLAGRSAFYCRHCQA